MGYLVIIAFVAMIGMYAYWFYTDFIRKRIEKRKAAKLATESAAVRNTEIIKNKSEGE